MCDDLIAHHYLISVPPSDSPGPNKPTPSFWPSSQDLSGYDNVHGDGIIPKPNTITLFTHFGKIPHGQVTWLIIGSEEKWSEGLLARGNDNSLEAPQPNPILTSWWEQTHGGTLPWTINSYSKKILFDQVPLPATPSLQNQFRFTDKATSIDLLYEMKLPCASKNDICDRLLRLEDFVFDEPEAGQKWYRARDQTEAIILGPERDNGGVPSAGKEFIVSLVPAKSTDTINATTPRVGFASVLVGNIEDSHGKQKQRFYVSNLFVNPNWRRKGAGGMLMEGIRRRVLEFASNENDGIEREIWFTVFAENVAALGMYFRLGCKVERTMWVICGGGGI